MSGAPRPLVFVCDRYPSLSQTFTVAEVRGLKAAGLPVTVACLHAPETVDPPLEPGRDPPVTILPSPFSPAVLGAVLRTAAARPARLLPLVLRSLLAQARPIRWRMQVRAPVHLAWACWLARRLPPRAHVHAQFAGSASTVAWMAARLAGSTFSFRAHAEWTFAFGRDKVRDAVLVLAISDHERGRLLRECVPASEAAAAGAKIRVLRLGVDLDAWPPLPQPAPGPLRIVAVGMLGATKGHDVLLQALALLRDRGVEATLDVAGEGPQRPLLEAIVRDSRLQGLARLRGALPHAEVRRLVQHAHVAALACRVTPDGDFDGIPVALMEAMATARPVVTCAVSALPELVEHGISGLVVAPERPAELADALQLLAEDPGLRSRMGEAARRRVEADYDGSAARTRLAAAFREILSASE